MENIGIEMLGLSTRSYNALKRANISFVDELIKLTVEDLYSIRNMGNKSVFEIADVISKIKIGKIDIFSDDGKIDLSSSNLLLSDSDFIVAHSHKIKGLKPENILYLYEDSPSEDISIDKMDFSVRSINSLKNNGCFYLSNICSLTLKELKEFKSLGKKSIDEIIFKTGLYTKPCDSKAECDKILKSEALKIGLIDYFASKFEGKEFRDEFGLIKFNLKKVFSSADFLNNIDDDYEQFDDLFLEYIFNDDYFNSLFKNHIISNIKDNEKISAEIILSNYNCIFSKQIAKIIDTLKSDNVISLSDNLYSFNYPSFSSLIHSILKEKEITILEKRLDGYTLEEIGKFLDLTRERVRQLEARGLKELPRCDEDKYKRLFETYYISKEDFCKFFLNDEKVYNYLCIRYKRGSKSIDELIDDSSFPDSIRFSAERATYKNYVLLDNRYIQKSKASLFEYIVYSFAQECIRFDDLVALYYDLLSDLNLSDNEKFKITRSYENRAAESMHILWIYPKSLRYYNIDSYDYTDLLETLNLKQYNNVEYSTAKFYNDNIDLMHSYDIRDEYELHNLLKKICNKESYPNIEFARMPIIKFGNSDRKEQIYSLLAENTPIGYSEFAKLYEKQYGVDSTTVLANYFKYVTEYLQNGVFVLNSPQMDSKEISFFKDTLKDDIYTLSSLKEMYNTNFPNGDASKINASNFKEIGYKFYSNYIISDKYDSSKDYFKKYLLQNDLFSLKELDRDIYNSQSLAAAVNNLKSDFEIIEYDFKKFININRIEKLIGIKKDELIDYYDHAVKYAQDEFFTVASLRYDGFEHKIDKLGFEDYFYSSILSENKNLKILRTGRNRLFCKTSKSFTLLDFIEWYIYSKDEFSIELYDLIDELKYIYHLSYERRQILETIKDSQLYYNSITDKIYADYDIYFDEI